MFISVVNSFNFQCSSLTKTIRITNILGILWCRGFFLPRISGIYVQFCLNPRDPRDPWNFHFRRSHGSARIYPCDSRDPWSFHFQRISGIYTDGSAQILVIRGTFISGGLSDFCRFILVILVIRGDMNALLLFIISICQLLLTKVLAIAEADFV